MELNIKKWELKKVLNKEFKINLPETDFSFSDWDGRVVTLVRPEYSKWLIEQGQEKEEIIGYRIIRIDDVSSAKIETGYLDITYIEDLLSKNDKRGMSDKDILNFDVARYIAYYFGADAITVEYFKQIYNKILNQFNNFIDVNPKLN